MAKQVIWSARAHTDRKEILEYWIHRNKSKTYSRKLNHLFNEAVQLVAMYPKIGKRTDVEFVRIKIVRDYFIIYEETDSDIHILTIWNSHQDPKNLEWEF
ncbi:type II toxin-antitoxin system RelE/ParE family toxin [Dyadobacter sp. OTU695]|uniref:type II toxin-antitoxin system RelE/ParE family toxin n=1 Tax=Dyadobacter sp. OTU695 TaxID=3043860 RepID=UPI00313ED215